jgi:GTPase SAR1 and related small G proteins
LTVSNYYRGAHVIVLVYDATDRDSLLYLESEMKAIQDRGLNESTRLVLIRNKIDEPTTRVAISKPEEREFLQNRPLLFRHLAHHIDISALNEPDKIKQLFNRDLLDILHGQTPVGYVDVFSDLTGKSRSRSKCC